MIDNGHRKRQPPSVGLGGENRGGRPLCDMEVSHMTIIAQDRTERNPTSLMAAAERAKRAGDRERYWELRRRYLLAQAAQFTREWEARQDRGREVCRD